MSVDQDPKRLARPLGASICLLRSDVNTHTGRLWDKSSSRTAGLCACIISTASINNIFVSHLLNVNFRPETKVGNIPGLHHHSASQPSNPYFKQQLRTLKKSHNNPRPTARCTKQGMASFTYIVQTRQKGSAQSFSPCSLLRR